jgi:hypothetical protein
MTKSIASFVYMVTDTNTGRFIIYDTKPNKVQLLDITINNLYIEEDRAKDYVNDGDIIVDKIKIHTLK